MLSGTAVTVITHKIPVEKPLHVPSVSLSNLLEPWLQWLDTKFHDKDKKVHFDFVAVMF